ncbi:hypothetical protein ACOMHN_020410 [Nucella lapillus]
MKFLGYLQASQCSQRAAARDLQQHPLPVPSTTLPSPQDLEVAVNCVQLEFGATVITEHPITEQDVRILVEDARQMIAEESAALARGEDPHDLHFDSARLFRPLPGAAHSHGDGPAWPKVKDTRVNHSGKTNKMASVVVDLMHSSKGNLKKWNRKSSRSSLMPSHHTQSKSCSIL